MTLPTGGPPSPEFGRAPEEAIRPWHQDEPASAAINSLEMGLAVVRRLNTVAQSEGRGVYPPDPVTVGGLEARDITGPRGSGRAISRDEAMGTIFSMLDRGYLEEEYPGAGDRGVERGSYLPTLAWYTEQCYPRLLPIIERRQAQWTAADEQRFRATRAAAARTALAPTLPFPAGTRAGRPASAPRAATSGSTSGSYAARSGRTVDDYAQWLKDNPK